mmetsp:Transcript_14506/g.43587  ORF Transcript_14506/g.43587 Transcript_14506/m.43587 type:complete len:789 (-) Transcript_14506:136-2502(-)
MEPVPEFQHLRENIGTSLLGRLNLGLAKHRRDRREGEQVEHAGKQQTQHQHIDGVGELGEERLTSLPQPAVFPLEEVGSADHRTDGHDHVQRLREVQELLPRVALGGELQDRPARHLSALERRVRAGQPAEHVARHCVEPEVHTLEAAAVQDELARLALADLDDAREDIRVVVALGKGGDGHDLRDGAEAEHLGIPQQREVIEALRNELERVRHEVVQAGQRAALILRERELAERLGRVELPDLLGPERAAVHEVLEVVPDDVGLLQEEAHGVAERQEVGLDGRVLVGLARGLEAGDAEEAREALPDEARDEVAVPVVLRHGGRALAEVLGDELGHALAHALRDVGDDLAGRRRKVPENARDRVELLKQQGLVALAHAGHRPVARLAERRVVKGAQVLALDVIAGEGGHVIFDGVEAAQDDVEDEHVEAEPLGQLANDGREGARDAAEDVVAEGDVLVGVLDLVRQDLVHAKLEVHRGEDLVHARELRKLALLVDGDLAVGPLLQRLGVRAARRHVVHLDGRIRVKPGAGVTVASHVLARGVEAVDGAHVHVLVGGKRGVEVLPPRGHEALHDDAEPGRPQQPRARLHHVLQLLEGDPLGVLHLLRVRVDLHVVHLREEDVVDLVLSPGALLAVRDHVGGPVVHAREELHGLHRHVAGADAELVVELAHGGALHAGHAPERHIQRRVHLGGVEAVERVRAARVRPHVREGDLVRRALLQQELALLVEQEDAEGAVQDAALRRRVEAMHLVLGLVAHDAVVLVEHDALVLVHEVLLGHARVPGRHGGGA